MELYSSKREWSGANFSGFNFAGIDIREGDVLPDPYVELQPDSATGRDGLDEVEEKKADSQARAEGARNRQAFIDSLLDLVTSPETDSDVIREARAAWLWFPEGKQLADRIESVYSEKAA
jgi:hypothetical protein